MIHLEPNQAIKTLCNGKSHSGGDHTWDLPTQAPDGTWIPGAWTPPVQPVLCLQGYHLTHQPARWWSVDPGATAYVAEFEGPVDGPESSSTGDPTKFAATRVRLLRPLTVDELAACGIYTKGEHDAKGQDVAWASGSAQVTAYDSAQVTAYDSAQVTAYDSAQVTAYGSAQVTAYGSAQVTAYDSSRVHVAEEATANVCSRNAVATRADRGVIVDRRADGTPKVYVKRLGLDGWRYRDGKFVKVRVKASGGTR